MSGILRRLLSLGRVVRRDPAFAALTCVAWVMLVIARAVISLFPLRRISAHLGDYMRETVPDQVPVEDHRRIRRIRRAIRKAVPHTPTNSNCYPQALTATVLLRLARVPSTMYYGAAIESGGSGLETHVGTALETHVWVRSGPFFVTGAPAHLGFATVATYAHVPSDSDAELVAATLTGPGSAGAAGEGGPAIDADPPADRGPADR
jgi:hypothetical protein